MNGGVKGPVVSQWHRRHGDRDEHAEVLRANGRWTAWNVTKGDNVPNPFSNEPKFPTMEAAEEALSLSGWWLGQHLDEDGKAYIAGPDEAPHIRYYVGCSTCNRARSESSTFFPAHRAMESCKSGGHPHCTCDTCF